MFNGKGVGTSLVLHRQTTFIFVIKSEEKKRVWPNLNTHKSSDIPLNLIIVVSLSLLVPSPCVYYHVCY